MDARRLPAIFSAAWFGPALVAIAAWIAIVVALDPAGSYPHLPEGPGLTVDEMFNVEQGVYLLRAAQIYGLGLLAPESLQDVFGESKNPQEPSVYLPDHPPFGRLWLGVHHDLARKIAPPFDPDSPQGTVTACARTGSATAFALTILLVGWFAGANYGPAAGWLASLFLALMPRLWGHAHLASLETVTNLTCTAALLFAARAWDAAKPQANGEGAPSTRLSLLAGGLLGLAFLTKIQAVFLPLPLAVWCLWNWRGRAIRPLILWGLAASVVFFVGWPWLWLDPVHHLREYFARTTARAALSVWYFGTQYADKDVPWHYPWVIFTTTLPPATLLLGIYGLFRRKSDPSDDSIRWLLLGNVVLPLVAFSLPGIAVYDGERLFLTVFPFWAILAARGAERLCEQFSRWQLGRAAIITCLIFQAGQLVRYQPCPLSYYNLFVGGTSGAERFGLETTYWGDSITRELLQDVVRLVPEGSTIHFAPVLHQFQLDDLHRQSPILRRHGIHLAAATDSLSGAKYVLLFRRRADLPDELRFGPTNGKLLAEVSRGGTQLAALYELH